MWLPATLGIVLLTSWLGQEVERPAVSAMRAAFVFNLVRFATWPSGVRPASAGVTICTLGAAGVADALEAMAAQRSPGGPVYSIRRLDSAADLRPCHVLYIGDRDAARVTKVVAGIRDLPVLTVGESEAFIRSGGIASLFPEKESMRIAVNTTAARRSNVQLSSRMLSLARVINGDQTARRD